MVSSRQTTIVLTKDPDKVRAGNLSLRQSCYSLSRSRDLEEILDQHDARRSLSECGYFDHPLRFPLLGGKADVRLPRRDLAF